MTISNPRNGKSFVDRMSPAARLAALLASALVTIFALGGIAGFTKALLEDGSWPSPAGLLAYGAFYLTAAVFGLLAWRLSAPWRGPGLSSYQRRYTRMWLTLLALGFPAGLLLGIANEPVEGIRSLAGLGPIDPLLAIVTAIAITVLLGASLVIYHRTIDDHEQQAYLWANSLAFYFLAIAFPVAWLLTRGGVIPPFGAGGSMLILLVALLINTASWAWLKFR